MKIHYYIILVFISSSVWAQNKCGDIEFLYDFLQGTYKVIGKMPDSNQTYTGKVILKIEGNQMQVIRKIGSKEIKGIGKIEIATGDEIKVLRVRFREYDKTYEVTYIINSDLDNYARLSGYMYLEDGGTIIPGMEALFIDHQLH